MSEELELVTDHDEAGTPNEWLVLRKCDGYVSIHRDYLSTNAGGQRCTWQDEGISVADDQIRWLVDALATVLPGEEQGR